MLQFVRFYLDFHRDTRGLTIVEYAIAGGLIALVVAAAFIFLGGEIGTTVNAIGTEVQDARP